MKPNFFIVGAPKCGTTAWVHYLSSHEEIFFSPMKEPHHFCFDLPNYRWIKDRREYLQLFAGSGEAKVVGEASVQYLYSDAAAGAIAEFNPDARIIILIRDQEEFLPSLHNQIVYNGDENITDFEQAWSLSERRHQSNIARSCREPKLLNYKAAGRFNEQIERYLAHFPPEQVRVFHFRDWTRDPRTTYTEMLRFLGVKDDGRIDFPPINEAKQRRINWLTPLVKRPPGWAATLARALRRAVGVDVGQLGRKLLRLNARPGSSNVISDELREEIRQYYAEDNDRLERQIWKPE